MSGGGRVNGRVAIVTGGSRGIGGAITQVLADEGARVLIADVLDEQGEALARALGASKAAYVHLDVRSRQQWEAAIDACQELFGPPTILVNNAGVMVAGPIEDSTEDQFHRAFEVNVLGPFLGTRAVIPAMRKAGGGSIIILSSAGGLEGNPGMALYGASKAANANFTKSAALELAAASIRVNAVAPGLVDTDMSRAVTPPEFFEASATGASRVGRPEDIAGAVVFLAANDARFITGAVLNVDGGYLAGHAPSDDPQTPAPSRAPATDRPPEPHAASGDPTHKKTESGSMKIHLGTLAITSSAFEHGGRIPDRYADGDNPALPPIAWAGAPEGVASFALVVHDPDAPVTHGFTHHVLYNIPATATELAPEIRATAGANTLGAATYVAPAPPPGHGDHFYYFELYALDTDPTLPAGLGRAELLARIDDHIIEQARIVGTYSR
jgi:3alpha(or 20beta)-hydroxysteroid dehydrogenase